MVNREKIRREVKESLRDLGLAVGLFIAIELPNQGSLKGFLDFVCRRPGVTQAYLALLLWVFSVFRFIRRRIAAKVTLGIVLISLSIANAVLVHDRILPLSWEDIVQLPGMMVIMPRYFSTWGAIGLFAGIFVLLAGIVMLWAFAPKRSVEHRPLRAIVSILLALICIVTGVYCFDAEKEGGSGYTPVRAYREYGFLYSFADTIDVTEPDEPENYSESAVTRIVSEVSEDGPAQVKKLPNIVFVQLESFMDPFGINGVEMDGDPCPVYRALASSLPHGRLTVPTVGGGTANTEFEVLTGLRRDMFTVGKYPYYEVLSEKRCEALPFVLDSLGYTSTAIHNYSATFYSRHIVYQNLGFDTFDALEYMPDVEYLDSGWADDRVLAGEIIKAAEVTEGPDFVFAITVSCHGKYSIDEKPVRHRVTKCPEELDAVTLQNYADMLSRTDDFIGELLGMIEAQDEPYIVVFYSDHLPAVGVTEDMLGGMDVYETEYVIWNNAMMDFGSEPLTSWQLAAKVLGEAGMDQGIVFQLHNDRKSMTEEEYAEKLQLLEYDLLIGEGTAYGDGFPYAEKQMRLGIGDIAIDKASFGYDRLLVRGSGFTPFSAIIADGEKLDTLFVDGECLAAFCDEEPARVSVIQITSAGEELTQTPAYVTGRQ